MVDSSATTGQDYRVCELTGLRLTLREDLQFTPLHEAGEDCYLIEDSVRSRFFRVGIAEYFLISMFDGKTTVGQATEKLARIQGDHAMTESEVAAVCKWLVAAELAFTDASVRSDRLADEANKQATQKRLGTLNPLCLKLPLAYPDRSFARITPWCRHAFGSFAAIVALVLIVVAVQRIALSWSTFAAAAEGIESPSRWFWLLACWVALKVIHETAHGVVCRKYGGIVQEAGLIFVLFAPLAYVDLTSSWRFRSKWQRIHTAAAGMYAELCIAALAAIAWSVTSPGLVNDLCFNLVVMASLTTLLFNANPLMRFDGYYMLSDWLEIPNLYGEGQSYLQTLGRKYVLGESASSQLSLCGRDIFIRVYGVAAFLWRVLICVSLVIGAAMLFHGLGLILAVAAVVLWIGLPMLRLAKYVGRQDGSPRQRTARFAIISCVFAMIAAVGLNTVQWPGVHRATMIVQYAPLAYVRADSPGFVREIYVADGQTVAAGDPIVRLENHELVARLSDLKFAIEQSILKTRVFKQSDQMHSYQAEMETLKAHRIQRDELQTQVDALILRSPADGDVVARNLDLQLGTFLKIGDEIAAVGDESSKELRLAIRQEEYDHFKRRIDQAVDVRLPGGIKFRTNIDRVIPRASVFAPDASMYASNGGELQHRVVESTEDGERFELLAPHFTAIVTLSPSQSRQVRAGQRGVVTFGRGDESIGSVLGSKLREALPRSFLRQYASLLVPAQRGL